MGSTSDGDKVLDILVAGLIDGSHCTSTVDLVGGHKMFISDC